MTLDSRSQLEQYRQDLELKVQQFRADVAQFQQEKKAFERQQAGQGTDERGRELIARLADLDARERLLGEQTADAARQQEELHELRQQFHTDQGQRNGLLAQMQVAVEDATRKVQEREQKLRQQEQQVADRREQDKRERTELARLSAEQARFGQALEGDRRALDEARQAFDEEQRQARAEIATRRADLDERERGAVAERANLQERAAQHQADVLALASREEELEQRAKDVQQQAEQVEIHRQQQQREGSELEEQFFQLDEYRAKLIEEAQRLARQEHTQDEREARLLQAGVEIEEGKGALADLEALQVELRQRDQALNEQRIRQEAAETRLAQERAELERGRQALAAAQADVAQQREQAAECGARVEAGERQLTELQNRLAAELQRLTVWSAELEQRDRENATLQEKLAAERQDEQQRRLRLSQNERECAALQEQLRQAAEELVQREQTVAAQQQDCQSRLADLAAREETSERSAQALRHQLDARQANGDARAESLEQREAELEDAAAKHRNRAEQLVVQRRALANERLLFQEEQNDILRRQTQARESLEALRREALDLLRRLPETGLEGGAFRQRLSQFRDQLRGNLNGDGRQDAAAELTLPSAGDASADDLEATCAWYRQRLRTLADAGTVPAPGPVFVSLSHDADGQVLPFRSPLAAGPLDQGDQRLGTMLRDLRLADADVLAALLAEARRQRRPLRQLLLAGNALTLYQLALIEAGHLPALMLGGWRVIDRIQATPHEAFYRVFDPRRASEALLRHLATSEAASAARAEAYRQSFAQAILSDPHVLATLEVTEINDRPAVLQEWLAGLPAADWPAQAAAAGACHRLLTQAAQGLAAVHGAGVVHGHLGAAHLLLTAEGTVKVCGVGEPPWLYGQDETATDPRTDLHALGRVMAQVCQPTGQRRTGTASRWPDALAGVLERLETGGYGTTTELLADLERSGSAMRPNAEAWERLLKHVRDQGSPEALLRQVA